MSRHQSKGDLGVGLPKDYYISYTLLNERTIAVTLLAYNSGRMS